MDRQVSSAGCSTSYGFTTEPVLRQESTDFQALRCNDPLSFELSKDYTTWTLPSRSHTQPKQPLYRRLRGGGQLAPVEPPGPSLAYLLQHRPLAAVSLVPKAAVLFLAGAVSGGFGTYSSPCRAQVYASANSSRT